MLRFVLLSLLVVSATGCITMAGNNLPDVEPQEIVKLPAIEQTVGDFSFHLDGGKMVTSNKMGRILNDEILGRWEKLEYIDSHRYVKSSQFTGATSYQVTLAGHQEGESSIVLQVISGLTLTAIPYYVDSKMDLTYSVHHVPSGCTFEASVDDSYNTVVGLLMLPAAPFAQAGQRRTLDRIAKNLYEELRTQGAFGDHDLCEGNQEVDAEAGDSAEGAGNGSAVEEGEGDPS